MKQITRTYHLFDAQGKILGRFAVEVARILSGKGKVDYTPNIDAGDCVVVINAAHIDVTGNKEEDKKYHQFSGYAGGLHSISLGDQRKKDPRKIIESAVFGMLPHNKLRSDRMKRLFIYAGSEHNHKTIHVTHS